MPWSEGAAARQERFNVLAVKLLKQLLDHLDLHIPAQDQVLLVKVRRRTMPENTFGGIDGPGNSFKTSAHAARSRVNNAQGR
jgi:hypothetical protein